MVKISVDIPDEYYERIRALSNAFKQDEIQTVANILKVTGLFNADILLASKVRSKPANLEQILYEFFFNNEATLYYFNIFQKSLVQAASSCVMITRSS